MRRYELVGNAVPPLLAEIITRGIVDGSQLDVRPTDDLLEPFRPATEWRGGRMSAGTRS